MSATMLLKTHLRCPCLLNPRHPLYAYSLFKYHAGCRLVRRFPSSVDFRHQRKSAIYFVERT